MAYRKDQWTASFEDQLSILRPHLTQRVLGTMGLAAWNAYGLRGVDPIETARAVSGDAQKNTGVGFVFDRSGFATWKLTEIRLPAES